MAKDRIITVYEVPEAKDGDIFLRIPVTADKDPSTMRVDRETGALITRWEEKLRYPFKTNYAYNVVVKTANFLYKFQLRMDPDGTYFYNGSNIPKIFTSLLGLNAYSPEGLIASLAHDNILQYKQKFYTEAKKKNPDLAPFDFLFLTTGMYKQLLRNNGIGVVRSWIMGFFINAYQMLFNPEWRRLK